MINYLLFIYDKTDATEINFLLKKYIYISTIMNRGYNIIYAI